MSLYEVQLIKKKTEIFKNVSMLFHNNNKIALVIES